MIELMGLTKVFGGGVRAVDDLTCTIEAGVVTGFLGPNGAGKTSTLRMILGLDHPTSGTATIGGSSYHELTDPLRTSDFAAVFDKGEYTAAYSGFEGVTADGTGLADWLRAHDVATVDVCGIATDYCVSATALDAARAGFSPTVLSDLTAAVAPDRVGATYDAWRAGGVATREG